MALLRGVVGHEMGVKAAGGIRTASDLAAMVDAGANRIGTSASVSIVQSLGAPAELVRREQCLRNTHQAARAAIMRSTCLICFPSLGL